MRNWVCIAAYDAGFRNSEGLVARSLVQNLDSEIRVILVTRKNNVEELSRAKSNGSFSKRIFLIGFDLPKWASWWKKGSRGYQLYAYLWNMCWPIIFLRNSYVTGHVTLFHQFNFHNDSLPNFSWILKKPNFWGPINHNDEMASWRFEKLHFSFKRKFRFYLKFYIRRLFWSFDPFLYLSRLKTTDVFIAGPWVLERLAFSGTQNIHMRSQLGVACGTDMVNHVPNSDRVRLLSVGRLDPIKGVELSISALTLLPDNFDLTIVGSGELQNELIALAVKLGVSNRVSFIGNLPQDVVLESYKDFSIFLFPSGEAGGLVWVEALASGVPVIGSFGKNELSFVRDCIPGIYTFDESGSFAEVLSKYVEQILYVSQIEPQYIEISRSAREKYSWKNFSNVIIDSYRKYF